MSTRYTNTCARILMAALFVMAANRQQPKCPPPRVRQGSWSLHTTEECSAIPSEGPLHRATWPRLGIIPLTDAEGREAERCLRQWKRGGAGRGGRRNLRGCCLWAPSSCEVPNTPGVGPVNIRTIGPATLCGLAGHPHAESRALAVTIYVTFPSSVLE